MPREDKQSNNQPHPSGKEFATGVIAELISLQTGHDGRRLAW
jgi:hypothetical protein